MQKYLNNVANTRGDAIAGALVTVTTLAGAAATLYVDNGVTVRVTPLTTDANGYFEFYAADGRYTLTITKTGITPITVTDILLEDPADGSAALAASSGASLVGWIQAGAGAVPRTLQGKARESVTVNDRGAVGDGATDDHAAVVVANTNDAAVTFSKGVYRISVNTTIDKDAVFWPSASLLIDAGVTVTFNAPIVAGPWQIFTGAGSVLLNAEGSHSVKPEWFGTLPDATGIDASVGLQKLSNSVVTGRECLVDFAPGTYYLSAGVAWSRACKVRGSGDRLTHFRCNAAFSDGDVFTTAEQGVEFDNIQFSSVTQRTSGNYINMSFNYCKATNIWLTDGFGGINVGANVCGVDKVTGFTWSSAVGSYIVQLAGGFNSSRITNIDYVDTGSNNPQYLVKVLNATLYQIDNLSGRGVGSVLGIVPTTGTAGRGQIGKVLAQAPTVNAVLINPTSVGNVEGIEIGSIYADGLSGYGLKIQKDTSNICKYIDVAHLEARACVGGLKVAASAGTVDHWAVRGGFARGCSGNGYDIANANYWSVLAVNAISNTGTGSIIASGCANFIYTNNHNLFNTAANLTDSSGAVTKVITNNI